MKQRMKEGVCVLFVLFCFGIAGAVDYEEAQRICADKQAIKYSIKGFPCEWESGVITYEEFTVPNRSLSHEEHDAICEEIGAVGFPGALARKKRRERRK